MSDMVRNFMMPDTVRQNLLKNLSIILHYEIDHERDRVALQPFFASTRLLPREINSMMDRIREQNSGDLPGLFGHTKEAMTCLALAQKTVGELLFIFCHEPETSKRYPSTFRASDARYIYKPLSSSLTTDSSYEVDLGRCQKA